MCKDECVSEIKTFNSELKNAKSFDMKDHSDWSDDNV